jgi:hypothetical protein
MCSVLLAQINLGVFQDAEEQKRIVNSIHEQMEEDDCVAAVPSKEFLHQVSDCASHKVACLPLAAARSA